MIRNISIGIDLGSHTTRVVVGEFIRGEKNPKVIGLGEAPTLGLRHGYVVDGALATESLKNALTMAEKTSNIKIRRAFIAIGGVSLRSDITSGTAIISKADGEVTSLDIKKALAECEDNLNLNNKKIIQEFPLSFRLDGKEVLGRIEGLRGTKLEAKTLFVTYSLPHLEDLLEVLDKAGIEPLDLIPSPLAGSHLVLGEKEKIVGAGLVNIGSETVTLAIFENAMLSSLHTFSIGGEDITNDIALGLKIPLERAENLKLGGLEEYSKKKLDEIIEARLGDIFDLIEGHLKKIKRSELLPAGLAFIGGAANTKGIEELAKEVLKLPARVGTSEIFGNAKTKLRDPTWFTALGLVTLSQDIGDYSSGSLGGFFKDLKNTIKSSLRQLMP